MTHRHEGYDWSLEFSPLAIAAEHVAAQLHVGGCPSTGDCGRWAKHRADAEKALDITSISAHEWPLGVHQDDPVITCDRCKGIVLELIGHSLTQVHAALRLHLAYDCTYEPLAKALELRRPFTY